MFFFLPWGHDQPVYERPWLTWGLILTCVAVFAITAPMEADAMAEVEAAAYRVSVLSEAFPDARIGFAVHGLPRELDALITPLVDESPERVHVPGDAELEEAIIQLVEGLNHLPVFRYGFRPGAPSAFAILAHAFSHADVFHLAGNMLFLWIAGGVLECFWRRWAYAALYALAGAAGLAAQIAAAPHSMTPMIGASGCIAGLMGAFLVGYPRTKIKIAYLFWVTLRPRFGSTLVPAWVVLPLWAIVELGSALVSPPEGGGVAYWAHVGGFVAGAVLALLARRFRLVATDAGYELVRGDGHHDVDARPPVLGSALRNAGRVAVPSVRPEPWRAIEPSDPPPRPEPKDIEASELPAVREDDRIER